MEWEGNREAEGEVEIQKEGEGEIQKEGEGEIQEEEEGEIQEGECSGMVRKCVGWVRESEGKGWEQWALGARSNLRK